jgi:V8-like Glu-specific endopeptidase
LLFSIDGSEVLAYGPTEYEPSLAQPVEAEATDSGTPFDAAWFAADPAGEDGYPAAAGQPVTSTDWPWSAIVRLTVNFPNAPFTYYGTGVMVGRNDVLTAAHLVYSPVWGHANSVIVTPAYTPELDFGSRYGSYHALVQIADTQFDPNGDGILASGNNGPGLFGAERDVALLALRTPLGDRTGWMEIDPTFRAGWAHLSGYPDVYGYERLTDDVAQAFDAASDSYTHISNFEVHRGNSGGPVWHYDSLGRPAVVAIVSTANTFNDANPSNDRGVVAFDVAGAWDPGIRQWMEANNHLIT